MNQSTMTERILKEMDLSEERVKNATVRLNHILDICDEAVVSFAKRVPFYSKLAQLLVLAMIIIVAIKLISLTGLFAFSMLIPMLMIFGLFIIMSMMMGREVWKFYAFVNNTYSDMSERDMEDLIKLIFVCCDEGVFDTN